MRVISGKARGLKLKAPEGISTRPTLDRIKESLFNMLAPDLYEARFLDIFSGSGAIGIEALSRGASEAVFIENSSTDIIKANIDAARMKDNARIIKSDAVSAIKRLGEENKKFDIIFMDPPYNQGLTEKSLQAIAESGILDKDGYIVAEQAIEEKELSIQPFEVIKIKKYRITKMTFLGYTED